MWYCLLVGSIKQQQQPHCLSAASVGCDFRFPAESIQVCQRCAICWWHPGPVIKTKPRRVRRSQTSHYGNWTGNGHWWKMLLPCIADTDMRSSASYFWGVNRGVNSLWFSIVYSVCVNTWSDKLNLFCPRSWRGRHVEMQQQNKKNMVRFLLFLTRILHIWNVKTVRNLSVSKHVFQHYCVKNNTCIFNASICVISKLWWHAVSVHDCGWHCWAYIFCNSLHAYIHSRTFKFAAGSHFSNSLVWQLLSQEK